MKTFWSAMAVCSALCAGAAQASVLVTITEIGSDVVTSHSGTLSLSALPPLTPSGLSQQEIRPLNNFYAALDGSLLLADSGITYSGAPWNDGVSTETITFTRTGDAFGFFDGGTPSFLVPNGFTGGSLSGGMVFAGESLASIGLVAGSYTSLFTWGTGGTGERIDLVIAEATPVPGPAALGLLGVALGGLFAARRRRRH